MMLSAGRGKGEGEAANKGRPEVRQSLEVEQCRKKTKKVER
jgi:hypothetical protein